MNIEISIPLPIVRNISENEDGLTFTLSLSNVSIANDDKYQDIRFEYGLSFNSFSNK